MDLDTALEIVNDPALAAFCDYTHATVQRPAGGFEFVPDDRREPASRVDEQVDDPFGFVL